MGQTILNNIKNIFPHLNLGLILIMILTFILGYQVGQRGYQAPIISSFQPAVQKNDLDFKLFWETWDLISEQYIDKSTIDPQKLYYGAIQGMVAALGDPYTVFLPPQSQKTVKEQLSGAFEGVGIQLGYNKDKRLVVVSPLKGTPAEKAGIKAGDMIIEINKKDTTNLSLPEAVSLIRGPKGTQISLAVYRESDIKPWDITLTRDTIVVKTVEFESKTTESKKPVAYLRLSSFGEKTKQEWDEAVSDALSTAPQGVIIDVRNDPGGFLDAAVYIASEFLDGGKVVLQEDAKGKRQEQDTIRIGKMLKIPVVVLINKGSASASEILAGAIQDRKRGTLVGEQSFGKGTIQSAEDLAENTGIHITTSKWLTPDGRWIHNTGLTPDVKVELVATNSANLTEDLQLQKALELLDK